MQEFVNLFLEMIRERVIKFNGKLNVISFPGFTLSCFGWLQWTMLGHPNRCVQLVVVHQEVAIGVSFLCFFIYVLEIFLHLNVLLNYQSCRSLTTVMHHLKNTLVYLPLGPQQRWSWLERLFHGIIAVVLCIQWRIIIVFLG